MDLAGRRAGSGNELRSTGRRLGREEDMMAETGKIRVGIGGWNFEPWEKSFYPSDLTKKRQLEFAGKPAGDDLCRRSASGEK